ncbi:MAG: TolC family protein [Alkalispirochaetaceae bacterium]
MKITQKILAEAGTTKRSSVHRSGVLLLSLFIAVALSPPSVSALSLEEFLADVRESHPVFVSEALSIEAAEAERETLRPVYPWALEGGPTYTTIGEVNSFESAADRTHNLGGTLRAARSLNTGGAFSAGIVTDYLLLSDQEGPLGVADFERYTQGVEFSYVQPLLRNRGDALRRVGYDLAAFSVEARRIESLEVQEEFLAEVAALYIDWAGSAEQLAVARLRVDLAEGQLAQVRSLFQNNLVDQVDVLRAQTALQGAEQLEAELEATEAALLVRLEALAGRDYTGEAPELPLASLPTLELRPSTTGGSVEGSIPRAAQPLAVLIEQLRAQRDTNRLRTVPELNLEVAAGLYGAGEKFGDSFALDSSDASFAIVGRVPLDYPDVESENRFVAAQIARLAADIDRIERDLAAARGALEVQLERLVGVIAIAEEQLASAQAKTRSEQQLYTQARVPLTTVIQSQDEEQQIRLALLATQARYQALAVQYLSLTDQLLQ